MRKVFSIVFVLLLLTACGGMQAEQEQQPEYEQTKKMIVDILQTEDGKKALKEIMQEDQFKQELVIESDIVKTSITEALASDQGSEMWKTLFQDPSFVKGYTEAIQEEQTEWLKSLMQDSEYQAQMLELFQNPEMTQLILSALKSQQFRAHLEETIQQTLETPLFQAKMQEILLQAAEEQASQQGGSGGGGENGGGGGSGGSGQEEEQSGGGQSN